MSHRAYRRRIFDKRNDSSYPDISAILQTCENKKMMNLTKVLSKRNSQSCTMKYLLKVIYLTTLYCQWVLLQMPTMHIPRSTALPSVKHTKDLSLYLTLIKEISEFLHPKNYWIQGKKK